MSEEASAGEKALYLVLGAMIGAATALLLAAAPDLLALARAWALTDPHGTHAKACRKAIANSGGAAP